jgi:multidrug resistance efflux pump
MVASASQLREAKASHQRLRDLVSEMILLSYSPQSDSEVVPQFLQRMVDALNARCGAIWSLDKNQGAASVYEYHAPGISARALPSHRPDPKTIAKYALTETGGVIAAAPGAVSPAGMEPHDSLVAIVVPIHLNGVPWGALELLPSLDLSERAQQDALVFVRHMARVLGHRTAMRGEMTKPSKDPVKRIPEKAFAPRPVPPAPTPVSPLQGNAQPVKLIQEDKYAGVLLALHESLDLEATAFVIANELRQLLRCDRVSVVITQNASCRMLAVSGQDAINRRADVVRQLESLAKLALRETLHIWLERDAGEMPAQFANAIAEYCELSTWKHLGIIPLRTKNQSATDGPAIAVLIVEQMKPMLTSEMPELAAKFAPHAARALANAIEQEQIVLLPLWKGLGRLRQQIMSTPRRKLASIAAGLVVGTTFLTFYPVAFNVQGTGTLQPTAQRDVFAEVDGIVTAIHVEHGDVVQQGDILLELRNTDLDVQIANILGERRSAQEQLASIQRMRHVEHISREEENRLSGQLFQLKEQLKGFDTQHKLLQKKKERLIVRSPMAGQVSTWNVQRQLMLRPVATGQVLITIADSKGAWNLEVYLPEGEAGHLLTASANSGQRVEYLVTSQPSVTRAGHVVHVDDTAQLYDEFGHAVRVLVEIDKNNLPGTPAGTTVAARISCGHKSIGYVWLHRLIDFVHTRVLFPLF